jgi:hypothetical protein
MFSRRLLPQSPFGLDTCELDVQLGRASLTPGVIGTASDRTLNFSLIAYAVHLAASLGLGETT